jgi:chromosome segregation ATPase
MTHYSIIVPDNLASKLDAEAVSLNLKKSTYITRLLRAHYEKPAEALETQIKEQKARIAVLQSGCTKLQDQLQSMQDVTEKVHALEASLKEADSSLNEYRERERELSGKLQLEKNSKEVVVTGMHHEVELLQQKVTSLEAALHTERDHLLEIKQDKDQLQKQLELVTLRLPAPKVGFWSRIFGGGRKKED